jgi:MFS family permease
MLTASSLLPQLSSDFIPVEVLLFGGLMLVIVVLIHGAGLGHIVDRYKRKADKLRARESHPKLAVLIFAGAILLMLALHISEAATWGVVLNKAGLIGNLRDSIYFSANTYTTIGYGKMILPDNWRELSPIMAISGLFTFAWTTGEMFGIVGQQRELMAELDAKRKARKKLLHLSQRHGDIDAAQTSNESAHES